MCRKGGRRREMRRRRGGRKGRIVRTSRKGRNGRGGEGGVLSKDKVTMRVIESISARILSNSELMEASRFLSWKFDI